MFEVRGKEIGQPTNLYFDKKWKLQLTLLTFADFFAFLLKLELNDKLLQLKTHGLDNKIM